MSEVRKAFRTPAGATIEVLRGVSFAVGAGEMVAIMGASGAGKSTLLHLIGGLDVADGGEIKLEGFDIARARGRELTRLLREQVGFVFQFHHLLADLTAAENVAMPLLINRIARRDAMGRAVEMLERTGLHARAAERVTLLSGGEQQRVAIARALVTRPRLVLADEPTGNLDARAGDETGALLASACRAEAAAVILATHNERLARLCDRRLLLSDGRLDVRLD
ncbi:MAG TPA: ABC transporter ATP-binding protein [Pyrinomonadaceae bacterium]|nr:ABC transporter ATP-binding protein [Pyrinomonadaceae bacterium]